MRIAVSGTHCSGKSTLIEAFLAAHPEYRHEPEPYEWLTELRGEAFSSDPDADDFRQQLEISVERFCSFKAGENVIAERSPLDFVAYLRALGGSVDAETAKSALQHIDLLVVLDPGGIGVPGDEDPELRERMNDCLLDLVEELRNAGRPAIVELTGPLQARLSALERAL